MASNLRRKSTSSGSRRPSSTQRSRSRTRTSASLNSQSQQWQALAGGRYSQQNKAGSYESLSLVRLGDLDRLERQNRAQKRYRRYLIRLSVIVSLFAALAIGAVVVYNSSLFTIENVQVSGVEHLTSEEMSILAAVPSGETLLRVDTAAIKDRLMQDAWVQDVQINRIFPSTLELVVTEREIAAVVEVPTEDATSTQLWAIASDHMWLMPIPDRDSEAGQRTSSAVYEDVDAALVIKDVPYGTEAEVGAYCTDESVLNALDIISGMTTELVDQVETVYADGVEETRLVLESNIEIAFGAAENIREKERVCLQIMEEHPDSVVYINVRDVSNPTYRAL